MVTRVIVTPALSSEFSVSVNVVAAADHPIYRHPCFQKLAVCTTTERISAKAFYSEKGPASIRWGHMARRVLQFGLQSTAKLL